MKKIFTLMLSLVIVAGAFAQYDRDYKNNPPRRDDGYGYNDHERFPDFSIRQRDVMIDKINYDYNARIEAIKCDPRMWRNEKKRAIRRLEKERQYQISMVYAHFNGRKMHDRHFDDRDGYAQF